MSKETSNRLAQLFIEVEQEFFDKSNEFVLEITAQRAREQGWFPDCDCGHVADAICKTMEAL